MRDDFTAPTKAVIASRAGYRCSNPTCNRLTSRAHPDDTTRSINIGVAAHIVAASSGGPRADASYTTEQRKSPENGIWLCQSCAHIIDAAESAFPIVTLKAYKDYAEAQAVRESSASSDLVASLIEDIDTFHATISLFIEKWQASEPFPDFSHFAESTQRLIKYTQQRLSAYNQEIMPLVADIMTKAEAIFGNSSIIASAETEVMVGPTNYISMRDLDECIQKIKSNLILR